MPMSGHEDHRMQMKILIIRFSSIGDIIQCMSVTRGIRRFYPDAEIHWVTRQDMASILYTDPHINKIWEFNRESGLKGLIKIGGELKQQNFDVVYDAHLNIRSFITRILLGFTSRRFLKSGTQLFVRKKNRINRMLFFNFNKRSALPMPFRGMISFQKPLRALGITFTNERDKLWNFPERVMERVNLILYSHHLDKEEFITLVPSAAWELKRWPVEHWQELVKLMQDKKFLILAGPTDEFTKEIEAIAPDRVLNLYGKTSLIESFYVVWRSHLVISADTGFLHAADLFGKKTIAFMGPTAFGHTTGKTVTTLEMDLQCRPCSKEGNSKCKLLETKKCLVDITPLIVKREVEKWIASDL